MLLSKGFEVEMYTGTPTGQIVGLSDQIVAKLNGFVREPDSRNVEYTTAPFQRYDRLLCELVRPRQRLRQLLQELGNYTIIPGSTLSTGDSDRFYRSDPQNPYHGYIEDTYGTKVVTASVHINIGIAEPEQLMQACRLVRMEAPLYLALTASSPFLDGQPTGAHSTRWQVFPHTPTDVPLFASHADHIDWVEAQLAAGTMQNVRHLWTSVRPNGDRRPYTLNRLELRICDLPSDPVILLAVTALLEARLHQLFANPDLDPLVSGYPPATTRAEALVTLTRANELAVASQSLDATLQHWQTGESIRARDWIEALYAEVLPTAKQLGIGCFITPIRRVLREGNEAQRWLQHYQTTQDVATVMRQGIADTLAIEAALDGQLCDSLVVA